jgi:tetratricopeptide (TPR) repeat protein
METAVSSKQAQTGAARTARGRLAHTRWLLGLALCVTAASCGPRGARPSATPSEFTEAPTNPEPGTTASPTAATPELNAAAKSAYDQGLAAFQQGDLAAAKSRFEQATSLDSGAAVAFVGLASIAEHEGRADDAIAAYDAALQAKPGHAGAMLGRVRLDIERNRAKQAATFAQSMRAKHPESAAALTAWAEALSAAQDSAGAQQAAQQALKLDPDFKPAMVALARDHYRARRIELAQYTLSAILDGFGAENPARDKDNADARLLRAVILRQQGQRQAALVELQRVIELRPDLVAPRLYLSTYLLEAGNADRARPILEQALKFEPANLLVHLSIGDTYRLLDMPKDALQHLEWVARRDPKLPQVQYNMGLVYLFARQIPGLTEAQAVDRAIAAFERYKELMVGGSRAAAASDIEELLTRAKNKKSILQLEEPKAGPPAGGAAGAGPTEG